MVFYAFPARAASTLSQAYTKRYTFSGFCFEALFLCITCIHRHKRVAKLMHLSRNQLSPIMASDISMASVLARHFSLLPTFPASLPFFLILSALEVDLPNKALALTPCINLCFIENRDRYFAH